MGDVPELQEKVLVLGYPTGGDAICVTEGVVSRVDAFEYSHSGEYLLTIQIDAAINSGNSGGPALCGSRVVGVAFESLEYADNIGYIIPIPVVRHFLADIAREGGYKGFPLLNVFTQVTENPSMRAFRRIPPLSALVQAMYPKQTAELQQSLNITPSSTQIKVLDDGIDEKDDECDGDDIDCRERQSVLLAEPHQVKILTPADVKEEDYAIPTPTTNNPNATTPTFTAYSTEYGRFTPEQCVQTAYGPMVPISIDGSVYYITPTLLSKSEDEPVPAPLRTFLTDADSDNASIGLTVTRSYPLTAVAEVIGSGDVILTFENTPIASNNTVVFRGRERVAFTHLVTSLFVGDKGHILFLRHRKFILEAAPTLEARRRLCVYRSFEQSPNYFVFMGMVFLTLSASFLEAACGSKWENVAPIPLLHILHGGTAQQLRVDEEVVLLSHVLVSEHNMGYEEEEQQQVDAVNGVKIVNLRHLATVVSEAVEKVNGRLPLITTDSNSNDVKTCAVEEVAMQDAVTDNSVALSCDNSDRFLRITLKSGSEIVLDILNCRQKHIDILKQHQIPLPGASAVVRAVWGDESVAYKVTEENGKRSDAGVVDIPNNNGDIEEKKNITTKRKDADHVGEGEARAKKAKTDA